MKNTFIFIFLLSLLFSCSKEMPQVDPPLTDEEQIMQDLNKEITTLTKNPLEWTDDELSFLDEYKDVQILGLGEATHGSGNIFESKFRIFRYMAEHHQFKTFVIEADFAESIYLNKAIHEGRAEDIKQIMLDKMHFYTTSTAETQNFLEWMAEYNKDKSDVEKIKYYGDDCQFLTFHKALMQDYFDKTNPPFAQKALHILDTAKIMYDSNFVDISIDQLEQMNSTIHSIIDSINFYKNTLIDNSSEYEFQLYLKLMDNFIQTMTKSYYAFHRDQYPSDVNLRDKYMATNTEWARNMHHDKTILWAHNAHVSNNNLIKSQGYYLNQSLSEDYAILGFAIGTGALTSWGIRVVNNKFEWIEKDTYYLPTNPLNRSFNYYLFKTEKDALYLNLNDIDQYTKWNNIFNEDFKILGIGAGYFIDNYEYNYKPLKRSHFDMFIYLKKSTPSTLLRT